VRKKLYNRQAARHLGQLSANWKEIKPGAAAAACVRVKREQPSALAIFQKLQRQNEKNTVGPSQIWVTAARSRCTVAKFSRAAKLSASNYHELFDCAIWVLLLLRR